MEKLSAIQRRRGRPFKVHPQLLDFAGIQVHGVARTKANFIYQLRAIDLLKASGGKFFPAKVKWPKTVLTEIGRLSDCGKSHHHILSELATAFVDRRINSERFIFLARKSRLVKDPSPNYMRRWIEPSAAEKLFEAALLRLINKCHRLGMNNTQIAFGLDMMAIRLKTPAAGS